MTFLVGFKVAISQKMARSTTDGRLGIQVQLMFSSRQMTSDDMAKADEPHNGRIKKYMRDAILIMQQEMHRLSQSHGKQKRKTQ